MFCGMLRRVVLCKMTCFRPAYCLHLQGDGKDDVEAISASQTSVTFYKTTRSNIPESSSLHLPPWEPEISPCLMWYIPCHCFTFINITVLNLSYISMALDNLNFVSFLLILMFCLSSDMLLTYSLITTHFYYFRHQFAMIYKECYFSDS
jgi:hypothetical protein